MVRKAISPIGEAREDWRIIKDLAKKIIEAGMQIEENASLANWDYQNTSEIMEEIALLTPSYAGVSLERLERGETLQWPVKDKFHKGTPILHIGQFSRGKGKFMPIEHVEPEEMPDEEFPMLLSTGRVLYHWHGGEMTRRSQGLLEIYKQAKVEIHPDDAARLDIRPNNRVRITSRRGMIEAEAWLTDRVPPGMIFANFHFPASPVNELTIAALDPVAKIPEYKICAIKVEKV